MAWNVGRLMTYLHVADAFLVFSCVWTKAHERRSDRLTARRRSGGPDVAFGCCSSAGLSSFTESGDATRRPRGCPMTSLPVGVSSGGRRDGEASVTLSRPGRWRWCDDDDDDVTEDDDFVSNCCGELGRLTSSCVAAGTCRPSSRDRDAAQRIANLYLYYNTSMNS